MPAAGTAGAISQYDAVRRAAECPARNDGNNTTDRNTYYLVNTKTERVVAGPEDTQADLFANRTQKQAGPNEEVVTIKPGTVVVQAQQAGSTGLTSGKGTDQYYVLRDNVALKGTDIKNPEQNFDQRRRRQRPADRHVRLHGARAARSGRTSRGRSPSAARRR